MQTHFDFAQGRLCGGVSRSPFARMGFVDSQDPMQAASTSTGQALGHPARGETAFTGFLGERAQAR